MRERIRISGEEFQLTPGDGAWTWERRPGGWMVGTQGERRVRFRIHQNTSRLSCHWLDGNAASGRVHGTWVETRKAGKESKGDLASQFPGKVRKIFVQDGTAVKKGEPLAMMEAMKMEFAIKAPGDGVIEKVLVKEGQQLEPGTLLFDFKGKTPHGKG